MLDDIIDRLLDVRNGRPGKQVQLTEQEIRQLCLTAKEIFMSQPNLLELEAPIKICGEERPSLQHFGVTIHALRRRTTLTPQGTYMGSTQTYFGCLSTGGSLLRPTTSSWETMWTAESKAWRPSVSCWHTR